MAPSTSNQAPGCHFGKFVFLGHRGQGAAMLPRAESNRRHAFMSTLALPIDVERIKTIPLSPD